MRVDVQGMQLGSFMSACGKSDPVHLAPMVDVLRRARGLQDVRAVVAAPVQHGKTCRE